MTVKRLPELIALFALLLPIPGLAEWVFVERVYDGDTFLTTEGTKVRVQDIDTPETHHPTIAPEPGGAAATDLARYYLEGKRVWLDGTARDRYGRRLATVRLEDKRDYSDIVRQKGYDKRSRASDTTSKAKTRVGPIRYKKIWVKGYSRKDGVWVSGHYRRIAVRPRR